MSQSLPAAPQSAPPCIAEEGEAGAPVLSLAKWFADEVQPHGPQLRSYLRGKYPSVRDVDDVVQESFLRLWQARARQSIHSAKAFLFQVARNVATDVIRHETCSPFESVSDRARLTVLDHRPSAADAACTREELALLADAIESLPPRCREIVVLFKLRRLSQRAIAAQLGIAEGTVMVHVALGVKRCAHFLVARGVNLSSGHENR
ncbi:MAG: polymerase, sigma-24 subunit, subfamily [Verrucomicrobia bacterium]|nr:polymerase, sigma-24 subunit, subfamily [Verrucomicrobiota bacterium]